MTLCEFIRVQDSIPVLPAPIIAVLKQESDSKHKALTPVVPPSAHCSKLAPRLSSSSDLATHTSREGNVVVDRATDTWFARRLRSSPYHPAAIAVPEGSGACPSIVSGSCANQ